MGLGGYVMQLRRKLTRVFFWMRRGVCDYFIAIRPPDLLNLVGLYYKFTLWSIDNCSKKLTEKRAF
jgi:hypothetical protein